MTGKHYNREQGFLAWPGYISFKTITAYKEQTTIFFLTVLCDPYKLLSLKAEILKSSDMHQC